MLTIHVSCARLKARNNMCVLCTVKENETLINLLLIQSLES